ncbi:MAG: type II toxin-antitoxin system HipA family toxin [Planctomycetes bacterium]|nr:type II toxin-antitoxin system HipA family toxin [Planctomycetota bacterium]
MRHVEIVEVRIWEKRVGAVALDPRHGAYAFGYDPAWLKAGIELAPLTMPARGYRDPFVFPALPRRSFLGLPGLLADALPDDFGNSLVDAWMASRGVAREEVTSLDRLAYMGKRGIGALEFKPVLGASRESAAPLDMKSLVEAARRALRGDLAGDSEALAALANIIRVGVSAGGARAKAVVAWNPETGEIRSGQFDLPRGFEHWLLKFDGVGKDNELGPGGDYGRIEYAYHLMAAAAGIDMTPCRLLEENGRAHFMTRRFDRDSNEKRHVQSLCALDHLDYRQRATHPYAATFLAASRLGLDDAALREIFRRMAFNVMARNCDDHTKNTAFRLKQRGDWDLAPAYDVTHAHNPKGEWTRQHLMSVHGKFDGITRADLLADADRFGIRRPKEILAEVRDALSEWPRFAKKAGLGRVRADRIARDFSLL